LNNIASPISSADHASTSAKVLEPLTISLEGIQCFNLPAPTQGVHSLQILGQVDRLKHTAQTESEWAHLIVEATKQSFADRPFILADLDSVPPEYFSALSDKTIDSKAKNIDLNNAQPWPFVREHGDTVWMGAHDKNGQMVSFIQSIYWEFGSANVIHDAGFVWNNRGISFSLDKSDINRLEPNKKPRHTLNPAMALFDDGKRLSYGTMGGEGQPQTQAAMFSRFVWQNKPLEEAIARGRWLLGRTWGDNSNDLKVEEDIAQEIGDDLTSLGHQWQTVPSTNEMMGHAGAIFDDHGELTAATDPRSDGAARVLVG
jgi:gamma-glutamyltranspeptidase/glutathione hydrolase